MSAERKIDDDGEHRNGQNDQLEAETGHVIGNGEGEKGAGVKGLKRMDCELAV